MEEETSYDLSVRRAFVTKTTHAIVSTASGEGCSDSSKVADWAAGFERSIVKAASQFLQSIRFINQSLTSVRS